MTDWLSRVFVEIAVSLSNSSRERSINSTERQAQGASATCNKNFTGRSQLNTFGQCQIYWEAGPQTSAQASCTDSAPTVIQLHRLDNSIKSEPVTRFILGLVVFFPKKATFKLSLMSNDENKFLPIFQILHINNVWFLLKLAMALVTSIVMKFAPVCLCKAAHLTINKLQTENLGLFLRQSCRLLSGGWHPCKVCTAK